MSTMRRACIAAAVTALLTGTPPALAAGQTHSRHRSPPRYSLIDVGTFGGPQAFVNLPGIPHIFLLTPKKES